MPNPFFADLVRELAQEGGVGPLTPNGAVPGHRRFIDAVPTGLSFHYAIAGIAHTGQWEVGLGHIDAGGRLVRDSVAASSSGGDRVDFAPGLKTIGLTVAADWFAASDAARDAMAAALPGKQPISTGHAAVATGADGDQFTVRRGEGWVNIPLSALVHQRPGGHYGCAGRLGVGTADPATGIHLAGPQPSIRIETIAPDATPFGVELASGAAIAGAFKAIPSTGELRLSTGGYLTFATGTTERMRITASGNAGIGTVNPATRLEVSGGDHLLARLRIRNTASGGEAFDLVAGIPGAGQSACSLYSVTSDAICWVAQPQYLRPGYDNYTSNGTAVARWTVVYCATGAINTSDATEKSWCGAADAAELRAARRIAGELGFFQWNDAIAAKGSEGARLHFGIRAQAVWTIMAEEGLIDPLADDALPTSRYAFLCHDHWEESGETHRRFGIRPDQLALFMIAAIDARLRLLESAA